MSQGDESKWIPGFENLYFVTKDGRVFGCKSGRVHEIHPQIQGNRGYLRVTLYSGGFPFYYRVHILVLETFIGPRPLGMSGLHKDDNALNNHIDNLYWGTESQNRKDAVVNGGILTGPNNPKAKLTERQVVEVRSEFNNLMQSGEHSRNVVYHIIANKYGVAYGTIRNVIIRETYRNV